jgi:hypothetical protein
MEREKAGKPAGHPSPLILLHVYSVLGSDSVLGNVDQCLVRGTL